MELIVFPTPIIKIIVDYNIDEIRILIGSDFYDNSVLSIIDFYRLRKNKYIREALRWNFEGSCMSGNLKNAILSKPTNKKSFAVGLTIACYHNRINIIKWILKTVKITKFHLIRRRGIHFINILEELCMHSDIRIILLIHKKLKLAKSDYSHLPEYLLDSSEMSFIKSVKLKTFLIKNNVAPINTKTYLTLDIIAIVFIISFMYWALVLILESVYRETYICFDLSK